jgi:drug/metabolite transporter (DMT)-like permease
MILSRYEKGVILTMVAAFFFAGKTIIAKLGYQSGADPISLLALRMIIAGAIFLFILLFNVLRGRWTLALSLKKWLLVIVLGFFGYYLSSFLDFWGLYYIDATLGRMILFLYPTMVVIIHAVIEKTMLPPRVVFALVISYLGLFLMMFPNIGLGNQNDFWKGSTLVFLAALVYSFYLTGVDRYFGEVKMGQFISLAMCFSCIAVFIHYLIIFPIHRIFGFSKGVYIYALVLGTVNTVIPIYAMSMGIALIGASKAAIYNMTGPIITLLMGAVILGERLGVLEIIGAFMIILGVSRARNGRRVAERKKGDR